ncbi:MAG: class I SAM-dependent methyltransferase [Minisyncoccia bacterium]|jgi:cyclopropane fatty-acyl-phospholipid synthase-like methyltransferase
MDTAIAPKTVIDCYSFLDAFASCGVYDYTEGKYNGDPAVSYEQAQANQAEYLLDQAGCGQGSKLLDIGCGNGRILEAAKGRGASAIGITISPEQAMKNNAKGLETVLLNYKDIPESWDGRFDCIIANGSIEHFVQIEDVLAGRQSKIYSEMFAVMDRILKPNGRAVTTVIHLRLSVDPREVARGPGAFRRGTALFHSAQLTRDLGGWYPAKDELIGCVRPYFRLVRREDGTDDYRRTSEDWMRAWKRIILTNPRSWIIFAGKLIRHPRHTIGFLDDLLVSKSWATQFWDWQGQGTPTYLFRDTWEKLS